MVEKIGKDITERVDCGVTLSQEASTCLGKISEETKMLQEKIHNIAGVLQQMAASSQQISQDIGEVAKSIKVITQIVEEKL
jgi:methyl-accepting chemotaxis protein